MRKYQFTGRTMRLGDTTAKQIVATRDFGNIKAGDIGGWIEGEKNLSQSGFSWIADNAVAHGNAKVSENAVICGNTVAGGNSRICGNVIISGHVLLYKDALVKGMDSTTHKNHEIIEMLEKINDARFLNRIKISLAEYLAEEGIPLPQNNALHDLEGNPEQKGETP